MNNRSRRINSSIILAFTLFLGGGGLYQFIQQAIAEEVFMVTRTRTFTMYAWGAALFALLIVLLTLWTKFGDTYFRWLAKLENSLSRTHWLNLIIVAGLQAALLWLVIGDYGRYFIYPLPRFFLVWVIALLGWLFWHSSWDWPQWTWSLLSSVLLSALVYYAAGYAHDISTYPLSLGWSEGSRYYYASTFFGESIYGKSLSLPLTHPSRYVMQAVPFLIPGLPLWTHRAWQAFMSLSFALLGSWMIARRLKLTNWQQVWLLTLGGALFLLQAPVFYQMMIIVVVMAGLVDVQRFWRTMLVVVLASLWAGITRINWVPMPALLAAVFYYLEQPLKEKGFKGWITYLWPSLAWFGGGMAAGLFSQTIYAMLSGNALDTFSSSFTSDLLWNRLWPNPSFPLGILTGTLLVSLPLLLYVIWGSTRKGWHGLRLLGLYAIVAAFFAGGVIVSVKIGGGTNLHNIDAYIVLLMIWAVYLLTGQVAAQDDAAIAAPLPQSGIVVLLLVPIWFAVMSGRGPVNDYDWDAANLILEKVQWAVDDANTRDKEILFISQRQLIIFGYLENVDLIPEYEKLFLMEMAMSRNDTYLSDLEHDLRDQRFAYIITDPVFVKIKADSDEALTEENDIWVKLVGRPILCAYESRFSQNGVQILEPLDEWTCD